MPSAHAISCAALSAIIKYCKDSCSLLESLRAQQSCQLMAHRAPYDRARRNALLPRLVAEPELRLGLACQFRHPVQQSVPEAQQQPGIEGASGCSARGWQLLNRQDIDLLQRSCKQAGHLQSANVSQSGPGGGTITTTTPDPCMTSVPQRLYHCSSNDSLHVLKDEFCKPQRLRSCMK